MIKYSIVVPIYNVEKYLKKCIDSIVQQTYKDIEIILVDDGSNDECPEICDNYAKSDSRIKVIHKQNGGLSDARNVGIENSEGQYIVFVDSDDYIQTNMIEIINKTIEQTNADIVCFNSNNVYDISYKVENNNLPFCYDNTKQIIKFSYKEAIFDNIARKHIRYEAWSKAYNKNLFEKIKFPVGMLAEDFATFYLFLREANNIVYIDYNLYNYVQRAGSIMNSKNAKLYKDIYTTEKEFYKEVKKISHDTNEKAENETRSFRNLAKVYSKLYNVEDDNELLTEIKENINSLNGSLIKNKYKLMYYIFKINHRVFVSIFNILYRKS